MTQTEQASGPRLVASQQPMPAQDLDAEGAVLGAVLIDSATVIDEIRLLLAPADMYADANRDILNAAYELDEQGSTVDTVTIAGWLRDRGLLQRAGGPAYLVQLQDATPAIANVAEYARRIRDKARVRRMVAACRRIAAQGQAPIENISEWLQRSEQAVFDVAEDNAISEVAEPIDVILRETIEDIAECRRSDGTVRHGTPCGFVDLASKLTAYARGKLYIVAGRPGMGKSAFMSAELRNTAGAGLAAISVSAEMTKKEQVMRLLAAEADIGIQKIMAGNLDHSEWSRVCAAADVLRKLPIALGHAPGATVAEIRSVVRRKLRELRRLFGKALRLGLVGIDYIQILKGRSEHREQEVSEISRGLLDMAGELDAPVMALSQLNRDVEKRPNKRAQLSDLRESGAIEQDAYAVMFLYRDEYYNKKTPDPGVVEVNVAKHRNGDTGVVLLEFVGESTRFADLDGERQAEIAFREAGE